MKKYKVKIEKNGDFLFTPIKKNEGLLVIKLKKTLYCGFCGMKIVNYAPWKLLHLRWHKK